MFTLLLEAGVLMLAFLLLGVFFPDTTTLAGVPLLTGVFLATGVSLLGVFLADATELDGVSVLTGVLATGVPFDNFFPESLKVLLLGVSAFFGEALTSGEPILCTCVNFPTGLLEAEAGVEGDLTCGNAFLFADRSFPTGVLDEEAGVEGFLTSFEGDLLLGVLLFTTFLVAPFGEMVLGVDGFLSF